MCVLSFIYIYTKRSLLRKIHCIWVLKCVDYCCLLMRMYVKKLDSSTIPFSLVFVTFVWEFCSYQKVKLLGLNKDISAKHMSKTCLEHQLLLSDNATFAVERVIDWSNGSYIVVTLQSNWDVLRLGFHIHLFAGCIHVWNVQGIQKWESGLFWPLC